MDLMAKTRRAEPSKHKNSMVFFFHPLFLARKQKSHRRSSSFSAGRPCHHMGFQASGDHQFPTKKKKKNGGM